MCTCCLNLNYLFLLACASCFFKGIYPEYRTFPCTSKKSLYRQFTYFVSRGINLNINLRYCYNSVTPKGSSSVHYGKQDVNRSPCRYSISRSKKKCYERPCFPLEIEIKLIEGISFIVGYIKFYGQNALLTKRSFNLSVSLLSVHLWSIKAGTGVKTNCSSD